MVSERQIHRSEKKKEKKNKYLSDYASSSQKLNVKLTLGCLNTQLGFAHLPPYLHAIFAFKGEERAFAAAF